MHLSAFVSYIVIASSSDASLPGCSAYFSGRDKLAEIENMRQDDSLVQEGCALNELNGNSCLHRQVEEQYQYQQYAGLNFSDDTKTKHGIEMNLGGHPVEYQVSDNVKLPRSIYDNGHHNWGPGHNSPGGIAMYNVNSYDQASFFTAYSPLFTWL